MEDRARNRKESVEVPVAIAAIMLPIFCTLITFAGVVAIVAILAKSAERTSHARQEIFNKVLESGVYDRSLLWRSKRGHASLGWGIVFTAIGVGLFIGFVILGILDEAAIGALVPLFIGIGLIIFYTIVRRRASDEDENGQPVKLSGKPPVATP